MFLREITDYRTADMINLDVPDKTCVSFPCTHYPTGGNDRAARRLCAQRTMGRFGVGYSAAGQSRQGKMLVATNVARKMSLDMRLLGDKFTDDPNNKASICARTIYDYYVSSNANRGTQFVFSDLATYKPNEWNIYSDIKDKLVAMGIPADEIQFIQYAKTERARKKLLRT